jgi:hypothetical protein
LKATAGIGWRAGVGLALALAMLGAGSARAAPVTVAGYGYGAGKVRDPLSVAVEREGGDLYVADRNNFRVDRFDAEGDFLLAWGWGVADGTSQELQTCGPPPAGPPPGRCFLAVREGTAVASGPGAVAPEAVAVAREGGETYLYVADAGARRRVSKFTANGEFLYMVGKEVDETTGANICTAEDVGEGDECGAGEVGAGANEFTKPLSLAVETSGAHAGRIWIGDSGRLQALEPDGTPGPAIALSEAGEIRGLAIDSEGNFYLKASAQPGIRKLHPDGTPYPAPYPLDAAGSPRAVTVDGEDNVYVGECGATGFECPGYRFMVFDPAGAQVSQFGAGQAIGAPGGDLSGSNKGSNALAVEDATGTLFTASSGTEEDNSAVQAFEIPGPGPLIEDQRAEDLLPASASLAAALNPEGHETEYHFEYGPTGAYGSEAEAGTLPAGFEGTTVQAPLGGLVPGTTYHFRLVATNHCNAEEPAEVCEAAGPDTTFTTRTAVGIEAQWAGEVADTTATLHATLDPLGAEEPEWRVEYGAGGALDHATPWQPLAAGPGAVSVQVALTGLQPGTTYRYRFVARGGHGGVTYQATGEPRGLATQLASVGFAPADRRAWEMVSPPNKHGGRIIAPEGAQGGQAQGAADGEALAYVSLGSVVSDPEGNRLIEASSVLARRGEGGSWSSRDITPPHNSVTPFTVGSGLEYKLFSPDLGLALLEPRDTTPLSPQATERTPYLRSDTEPPSYEPLVTAANVAPGTPPFGGDPAKNFGAVSVKGASADLRHVVLRSTVPLAAGVCHEVAPGTGRWDDSACSDEDPKHEGDWEGPKSALYEWSAGALEPLSAIEAEGEAEVVEAELGSGSSSVRGAVSEDGSRVFFTADASAGGGLYVRDTALGQTARLDEVKPGAFGTGEAKPVFQSASADGSVAYFTDTRNLTPDANEAGTDLYRCDVAVEGGELRCELTDLTAGEDPSETAQVQGLLAGMSEDGSRTYFVARGALDEAPNAAGARAAPGQPNLYAWSAGAGTRFVATLAEEDEHDWGVASEASLGSQISAAASPSGRYLAFMSKLPLTGYDNRDLTSGERVQEVFRYDSQTEELTCASCDPSGARPRALRPGPGAGELPEEFDPRQMWLGVPVAAVLPEATSIRATGNSLYRPRAMLDNGRLFFNAADSLVPADSNEGGDVYEYEPLGAGSCEASSGGPGIARVGGGCLALISSGAAEGSASFLDASQSGDDVFFYTPARLSVTDKDEVTDVYDARSGGVAAREEAPVRCLGEACQPPAIAPEAPSPASAAFRGPGNAREGGASRCAAPARKARRLSRRARRARRAAKRMLRRGASPAKVRRVNHRARRLAHAAQATSKRAKRCRRRARATRRSRR